MEPHRTSPLRLHHSKLTRQTLALPCRDRATDRRHDDQAGLAVHCCLDDNNYPKAIKVSDAEMAQINIKPDHFHGEWNYTISPAEPTV